jgi:hypothetical protein
VRNETLNQHNTENLIALIEGRNIAVARGGKKSAPLPVRLGELFFFFPPVTAALWTSPQANIT